MTCRLCRVLIGYSSAEGAVVQVVLIGYCSAEGVAQVMQCAYWIL